ncbi:MAG: archease [Candidatus Thorarchaeota archaeon]|nr:MAG: archease [Candidatus Thorarchaeota archaeon]
MDRGFRFHEHTADIIVECWAPTLSVAFEEAALATLEVILDTKTVDPLNPVSIEVNGIDRKELLVEWIGRIIALIDINQQFFSKFEIERLEEVTGSYVLNGTAWGESIDLDKHDTKTEVKAMTYADLRIIDEEGRVTVWFTLDL